jgi:hypothetical protein
MRKYIALFITLLVCTLSGCCNGNAYKNGSVFPFECHEEYNFYERHLGDHIWTDALNGCPPAIVFGMLGNTIEQPWCRSPGAEDSFTSF